MIHKTAWLSRLVATLSIIRPINCFMIGFAVVVGELITLGKIPLLHEALLGASAASFLMAGTMAINDYYDLEIDRINSPSKPLPLGSLTPHQALMIGVIAGAMGLAASALLNICSFAIAVFAFSLMLFYNTRGKKTGLFGNVLVSTCIGLPFIFGGAVVGKITFVLVFFALMSFTANLGREVAKGIVDIEGDRSRMVNTVAVAYGSRKASQLAATLYFVAVGLSSMPPALSLVGMAYLPLVLISDIGFVSSGISLMRKHDRANAKRIKNKSLIWMFLGLLAFVAGSINSV